MELFGYGLGSRTQALDDYARFSNRHAPAFAYALALQRVIPRIPPRVLTALLRVVGRERPCRRGFTWYLEQAHPRFVANGNCAEHEAMIDLQSP